VDGEVLIVKIGIDVAGHSIIAMSFVPLDKLIISCQPLYDARISEMRKEIEELKIQVFWNKHTLFRLHGLIRYHGGSINCCCGVCVLDRRSNGTISFNGCKWQPIFEALVKECDLIVSSGHPFYKNNAHLISGLRGDWFACVGFGELLKTNDWKVLNKYEKFVETVWEDAEKRYLELMRELEPDYVGEYEKISIDDIYSDLDGCIESWS